MLNTFTWCYMWYRTTHITIKYCSSFFQNKCETQWAIDREPSSWIVTNLKKHCSYITLFTISTGNVKLLIGIIYHMALWYKFFIIELRRLLFVTFVVETNISMEWEEFITIPGCLFIIGWKLCVVRKLHFTILTRLYFMV